MQAGDRVEFIHPEPRENEFPMYIVWIDPPRAMIRSVIPGHVLKPTQVVNIADIQPAKG